jgi:hypothetical protein
MLNQKSNNSYLFNEFVCNLGFFWHEWANLKLEWNESFKGPRVPKKRKLHKNELNTTFFCSTSPPKSSKWLKIFKISLTFRFDTLSNSSKSVHTGENSQILTVSNKQVKLSLSSFIFKNSVYTISQRFARTVARN